MDIREPVSPRNDNATSVSTNEAAVLDAIRATPFGTVEVVLHQSRIVQVVRTQKLRLADDAAREC